MVSEKYILADHVLSDSSLASYVSYTHTGALRVSKNVEIAS